MNANDSHPHLPSDDLPRVDGSTSHPDAIQLHGESFYVAPRKGERRACPVHCGRRIPPRRKGYRD